MSNIIKKIHSTGYWRVLIRPTAFIKERIPSLTKCREILSESVVSYRGWDYPHYDNQAVINRSDFIEQSCEFMYHYEYWKFFQNGQFIHHFACQEDYFADKEYISQLFIGEPSPSGKYLSILSTLYTITEIFQFANRLCLKEILEPNIEISIGLHGTEGRKLIFTQRSYDLSRSWISSIPEITFNQIYSPEQVISSAAELAMIATIYVFERFNWPHHSNIIYPEEQKKLLEKRL